MGITLWLAQSPQVGKYPKDTLCVYVLRDFFGV